MSNNEAGKTTRKPRPMNSELILLSSSWLSMVVLMGMVIKLSSSANQLISATPSSKLAALPIKLLDKKSPSPITAIRCCLSSCVDVSK